MRKFYFLFFLLILFPGMSRAISLFSPRSDTTVRFLRREARYDPELKDTINTIVINDQYCKVMSDAEKAAIAYVAFNIENDCEPLFQSKTTKRDSGEVPEFNVHTEGTKCKIPSALGLGYQCSDTQRAFLQKWFRNDAKAKKIIENCQTVFWSFHTPLLTEMAISSKENLIRVKSKFSAGSMFGYYFWSEDVVFRQNKDCLKVLRQTHSKEIFEPLEE